MKKKMIAVLMLSVLLLPGCGSGISQDDYNLLSSKKDTLQENYNSLLEEKNDLEDSYEKLSKEYDELLAEYEAAQPSTEESAETASESAEVETPLQEQSDSEAPASQVEISNNDENQPSDLELMAYAKTVLRDYYPECKCSSDKSEYNFVKTGIRYKIEGNVHRTKDAVKERFAMVIRFADDSYEEYDLVSLQIASDKIYFADDAYDVIVSEDGEDGIVTVENAIIYNEVLDALNAEPDREESEILVEIAPNYDMTADELETFIRDFMAAYYE